jgi:hypothetical protein
MEFYWNVIIEHAAQILADGFVAGMTMLFYGMLSLAVGIALNGLFRNTLQRGETSNGVPTENSHGSDGAHERTGGQGNRHQ